MKKMNNKGFAISTLLYGLLLVAFMIVSLLMSLMSTNRKNTSTLVRKIEEELNRYSETATELTSTDTPQEFIVPYGKAGWYKIELWGAGNSLNTTDYGQGTYTSGIIYLEENQHLYFYIGKQRAVPSPKKGEGLIAVGNHSDNDYITYASSEMSTDVRLESGARNDSASLKSRIMIASGGNGGQSYISGYAGTNSIKQNGTLANSPMHYSNLYFTNGLMLPASNSGAGMAKIALVSTTTPANNNNSLNSVIRIQDCIDVSGTSSYEHWSEIQAISGGKNIALNKTATLDNGSVISGVTDGKLNQLPSGSSTTGHRCITVNLNGAYNLEEIAIFHKMAPHYTSYAKEQVTVTHANGIMETVLSWSDRRQAQVESTEGIRISSKDITSTIIPGKYYIQSITYPASFVSAVAGNAQSELFSGSLKQTWVIEPNSGAYSIINSEDGFALQSTDDYLYAGNNVVTSKKYNGKYWETWQLIKLGNGYYKLQLYQPGVGALCLEAGNSTSTANLALGSCSDNPRHYFKLISADY